jgi:hypothetical protein
MSGVCEDLAGFFPSFPLSLFPSFQCPLFSAIIFGLLFCAVLCRAVPCPGHLPIFPSSHLPIFPFYVVGPFRFFIISPSCDLLTDSLRPVPRSLCFHSLSLLPWPFHASKRKLPWQLPCNPRLPCISSTHYRTPER